MAKYLNASIARSSCLRSLTPTRTQYDNHIQAMNWYTWPITWTHQLLVAAACFLLTGARFVASAAPGAPPSLTHAQPVAMYVRVRVRVCVCVCVCLCVCDVVEKTASDIMPRIKKDAWHMLDGVHLNASNYITVAYFRCKYQSQENRLQVEICTSSHEDIRIRSPSLPGWTTFGSSPPWKCAAPCR